MIGAVGVPGVRLCVLLALLAELLQPTAAAARGLRQSTTSDGEVLAALRTHIDGYSLISDEGRTCYNTGEHVMRGSPLGCGLGCQYVSQSFTGMPETSATLARGPEFFGKPHPIVGPPDAWPSNRYSDYAWTPVLPDKGEEHITVRVTTPVIVTGMHVYEVNNPGAIVEIRGRMSTSEVGQEANPWITLWSGPVSPAADNGEVDDSGRRIRSARIWRPPVAAPRTQLMDEFYLKLNTSAVAGFNQIDAIKVYGDLENGMPVQDFVPQCVTADDEDCWTVCRPADVLTHERLEATIEMVTEASSWLSRLLRVVAGPANLLLPLLPDVDTEWVGCGDLELSREPFEVGLAGAKLALFPTARPAAEPLSVSTCLRDEGGIGRPLAIRLNIVPQFAESARLVDSTDAARDAIVQQLYLALGWSTDYKDRLVQRWGLDAHRERNPCNSSVSAADCNSGWAVRYRITRSTPMLVAKAAEHFGVGPSALAEGVELEQVGSLKGEALKLRLFNGEVMATNAYLTRATHDMASGWTFPANLRPASKSSISLGLFEDLGWYFPVYDNAEALPWGAGQGLDFALSPCNSWADASGTYVCPRVGGPGTKFDSEAAGTQACNAARTHVGLCSFVNHPQPLPDAFDYFDDSVNAINWGGASALADYCPLILPEPSGVLPPPADATVRDCTAVRTTDVIGTNDYQNQGPGSACFEGRRANQAAIVGCYKHFCDADGTLSLAVGHEVQACPPEGGELYFQVFSITLTCPPSAELCHHYATSVPVSVRAFASTCPATSGDCRLPDRITMARLNVGLEVTNFEFGEDGTLKVSLGGHTLVEWQEDPAPGELRKRVVLRNLPHASNQQLRFELIDRTGEVLYSDVHTISVSLGPNSVYATDVIDASSSYVPQDGAPEGEVALPASAILGQHDQARAQHSSSGLAWSPARGGAGEETLTLRFGALMYPTAVVLYENLSPGSLVRVEAQASNRSMIALFAAERDDLSTRPSGFPEAGSFLTSGGTSTVDLRFPPPFRTDTLRLTFATPSWPEIDAVKMIGYAELLPTLSFIDGIDALEAVVPARGSTRVTLTLAVGGTSLLIWSLHHNTATTAGAGSSGSNLPDWLVPDVYSGVASGGSLLALNFTVAAPVGAAASESLSLTIRNAMLGPGDEGELLTFRVLRVVDYSTHPEPSPPLCYHGTVTRVDADRTVADRCECQPGAFGQACEFLTCPSNCSTPVGADLALAAASLSLPTRGTCDARRGQCVCFPGYSGIDCSGQDGDCYVSFDGRCRAGWQPGRFILNTEDENNINRGTGLLPRGFLCNDEDEQCYQNLVTLQFCCRASQEAACPFEPTAPNSPCSRPACTQASLDWSAPDCLAAVQEYCFFEPGDAACHAFRPIPIPPLFCPLEVALEWCARDGADRPECADVLGGVDQRPSGCAFQPLPGNPCEEAICAADSLSPGCAPHISSWCAAHPEDPECEAHLAGDACLFAPESPPCVEAACLPESYSARVCDEVIAFHCGSTAGDDDPECGMYGFGTPPPHAQPSSGSCPWDAIQAHCHDPSARGSPGCRLLHAYGVVDRPSGPSSVAEMRSSAAAMKVSAEASAELARSVFDAFAIQRERRRRSSVARHSAYMKLFLTLDANADARMVSAELASLPRAIRAAKAALEISPLGAAWIAGIPKERLMESLALGPGDGNYISFSEFAAVLEDLYRSEVEL